MPTNELMGISQVHETERIDEVNVNLEQGWKLLQVYTYAPYADSPNDLTSVYSLGWPAETRRTQLYPASVFGRLGA